MCAAARRDCQAPIPCAVRKSEPCAGCSAMIRTRPTSSSPSARPRRPRPPSASWSPALARWPGWACRSTRTCCGTRPASSWPTTARTPAPSSITWATGTSSTLSSTPTWRPSASTTSGTTENSRDNQARKRNPLNLKNFKNFEGLGLEPQQGRRAGYNHACASPHGRRSAAVGALQIWLFSSTDRAWSGGLIYSPTTSRTLSTKAGSRETLNPLMRLQAVLAPDLLDGGVAQANRPGQAARAPVRGVRRHRALHHRAHLVRPDHRRPPRTWPVAQQAIHAFGDEPFPPPPNRALGFADLTHDRHRANTRGRQQHDPRPPHVFLLHTRGGDDGFQTRPRRRRHSDLRFLFHPNYMGNPATNWNLTSRAEH